MAEMLRERWTQWAALTTTIFAVCAAISAARGGTMSTRTMVTTTKEANAWAYFQAKSIKQHVNDTQIDAFELERLAATLPEVQRRLDGKIRSYREDVARYDKEKADIQEQAESLAKQADFYKIHGGAFSIAVMMLQIAIMMNSVGALLKQKAMWIAGMLFGAVGVVYMLRGFLL
jgi:hypothetical protein